MKAILGRSVATMRLTFAAIAMATISLAASDDNACQGCHPGMSDLKCGVYTLNAISGCCGMGEGSASCDGAGFAVNCDGGGACICDDQGEDCQREDLE